MATPSESLSTLLQPKIKQLFGTQRALAKRIGLGYEHFRKALSTDTYVRNDLMKILVALEIEGDLERLHEQYNFQDDVRPRGYRRAAAELDTKRKRGTARLRDAFHVFEEQIRRLQSQFHGFDQDVERAFAAMRSGDVMVLCLSDDFPIEWTGEDSLRLLGEVAELIKRGGCICYLYPSRKAFDRLQIARASDNLKHPAQFASLYSAFQGQLHQRLLSSPHKASDYVAAIPHHQIAYFAAGHKYCLYFHREKTHELNGSWAVAAVPIAMGNNGVHDSGRRVFLPLSHEATYYFYNYCLQVIGRATHSDGFGRPEEYEQDELQSLKDQQKPLIRALRVLQGGA